MKITIDLDTTEVTSDYDMDAWFLHTVLVTVLVTQWRDSGRSRGELLEKIRETLDIYDQEVVLEKYEEGLAGRLS